MTCRITTAASLGAPRIAARARNVAVGGGIIAALLLVNTAPAQRIPDAGSTLRQLEPPTLTIPRKPPPAVDVEPPARPALQPAPAIRFVLKAFRITGGTVFSETQLQQLVQEYVGREVGISELGEAASRITRFYSERGYPLATAYLPAQDIKDGVVELVVLEGRFGNVHLLNHSRVRDAVIATYLDVLPGRIVEERLLERQLLLAYDLAGVIPSKAVLSPGEAVGETDLRVELDRGNAFAGSIGFSNYGNKYNGQNQLSAQMDVLSPTGSGDVLSALLTKGFPGLEYGRLSYVLPLGSQGLRLGASYSRVNYSLGGSLAPLAASGDADHATAYVSYPLVRSRRYSLYARAGYEYKSFQDRIGATATLVDRNSNLATLTVTGNYFDGLLAGAASAFSAGYVNGNLNIETPAARAIDAATVQTQGNFGKWIVSYVRQQNLSEPLSALVSFYGQKAIGNLDSAEKLILGGANGVRAYPQGEAPGDTGYLLTGEIRHTVAAGMLPGVLQVTAFIDTGWVKLLETPFNSGSNQRRLSGGGFGLNLARANDFTLQASIAHRIGNTRATAGSDNETRGWIQAIKFF